jgi:hypothetical protein
MVLVGLDERVASINVQTERHCVTLKYRSRFHGDDWSDVEQRVSVAWTPCRFGGERPRFVCSAAPNGVYCGRPVIKPYGAGRLFAHATAIQTFGNACRQRAATCRPSALPSTVGPARARAFCPRGDVLSGCCSPRRVGRKHRGGRGARLDQQREAERCDGTLPTAQATRSSISNTEK